jgi:hypothetical protein
MISNKNEKVLNINQTNGKYMLYPFKRKVKQKRFAIIIGVIGAFLLIFSIMLPYTAIWAIIGFICAATGVIYLLEAYS